MLRVTVIVEEIWERATDEDCAFPVFLHWFMRAESAVGKFFIFIFFWWGMLLELSILIPIILLALAIGFVAFFVPILNICMLIDAHNNDDTSGVVLGIIGIIADVIAGVVLLILYLTGQLIAVA